MKDEFFALPRRAISQVKTKQVAKLKTQTTSKNSQRYYTTERLIRDLLSNTPNCYVCVGRISRIFISKVCEAERNWRGKSS